MAEKKRPLFFREALVFVVIVMSAESMERVPTANTPCVDALYDPKLFEALFL
jgi:hypothetical protein